MKWIEVACELCGTLLWLPPQGSAEHLCCPKRKPGHAAPRYRKIETVKL